MTNEINIGAYLCCGCGIGERLDGSQMEMIAVRDGKASFCKTSDFLCSQSGVQMIQKDIDDGLVNHLVIMACSRRAKNEAFRFDNVTTSRANLREGVIWIRPDSETAQQSTQEMANDYIRMACAEARNMRIPEASEQQSLNRKILVVGGGISGMTTALESARAGYQVEIVEKSSALGGWMGRLYQRLPVKANPNAMPLESDIDAIIEQINSEANITLHLNATIAHTEGAPGRYRIVIATESGSSSTIEVGAIVQATGYRMYDPSALAQFLPTHPDVLTNMQLEALAKNGGEGPIKRPSDGKVVSSVIFIQNVGQCSDQQGQLDYHSGIGDLVSIKQALYFKVRNGLDCATTILFDHLRTPGAVGEDFYRSGQRQGVTFRKGRVSAVLADAELSVDFKDMMLDQQASLNAELVILEVGMVPNSGPDPYAIAGITDDEATLQVEVVADSILNLDYLQGTDLPQLKHGFTDSHFICFPYETRRSGIYAAGSVRRPMDIQQAREDATGAALKAIQALENAARGRALHPRSGDLSYPQFRKEGCTRCKRCTIECPFGAIDEDEMRYPQFNESRCRRCATCMGACPVRVISFENYSVQSIGQQILNVDIPDESEDKPRILVLACENDAYPALDMAAQNRLEYSAFARIIPVRCLGSVNTLWLTDALNSGYDGIVLMGCSKGENYQCHFVKGSEMAQSRMDKITDTLQVLGLEEARVATYDVAISDIQRAPRLINKMAETIGQIGLSRYKF